MEKNITERLFDGTAKKYDAKHINNVSTKTISKSIINDIEENGISSEMLDKLKMPVFRYRTQVTIHGIFPDGCEIRVGGYKNLTKNGNGSLGVRYTAIDRSKKRELYSLSQYATPDFWRIEDNSEYYALYHQERLETPEQYKVLKDKAEQINKALSSCAFAVVSAYAARSLWGGIYGVIFINISAFYKKDFEQVFRAINPECSESLDVVIFNYQAHVNAERERRDREHAEWKERYERERLEREQRLNEEYKAKKAEIELYAAQNGFAYVDSVDLHCKTYDVIMLRKRMDGIRTDFCRFEGKNKLAKIKHFSPDWKYEDICASPSRTDKMTLKSVWIKPVK